MIGVESVVPENFNALFSKLCPRTQRAKFLRDYTQKEGLVVGQLSISKIRTA